MEFLDPMVVSALFILISGFCLYLIIRKADKSDWIGMIFILSFTIVYFSTSLIFDLAKTMYEVFHSVDTAFRYSDSLNAVIAILGVFGTVLSLGLTYIFNTNKKRRENILELAKENKELYDLNIIDFHQYENIREKLSTTLNQDKERGDANEKKEVKKRR